MAAAWHHPPNHGDPSRPEHKQSMQHPWSNIGEILSCALALLPCTRARATDAVPDALGGRVFLDVNGDGKAGPSEEGDERK